MLRNLFADRLKRFYSVENLVQNPVGEQDKTHEFGLRFWSGLVNKSANMFLLIVLQALVIKFEYLVMLMAYCCKKIIKWMHFLCIFEQYSDSLNS